MPLGQAHDPEAAERLRGGLERLPEAELAKQPDRGLQQGDSAVVFFFVGFAGERVGVDERHLRPNGGECQS